MPRPRPGLLAGLLLAAGALVLPSPARPAPAPAETPPGRVIVRSGDAAPGIARLAGGFSCGLAVAPGGELLFVDAARTALFRRTAEGLHVAAHAGDAAPGGGRFAIPCDPAAGADGTIAFRAALGDGRLGVFRSRAPEGPLEEVLRDGSVVTVGTGTATVAYLGAPAVDGAGTVVLGAAFLEGPQAILRIAEGSAPHVLLKTGDPLAGGIAVELLADPAVNAAGTVTAQAAIGTSDGQRTGEVVATVTPDGAARVAFVVARPPGQPGGSLAGYPAAINEAGEAAFLWYEGGRARLQKITADGSSTLIAEGAAAPGGGTFTDVAVYPPAIDAGGRVLFGAGLSDGREGIFVAGPPIEVVAEEPAAGGGLSGAAPVFAPDGRIVFASQGTIHGAGIFAWDGTGAETLVRDGDPIPGPRFAALLETAPWLAVSLRAQQPLGPMLAPGGRMIFDARVSGGARGLYERDRAGRIQPVAVHGDVVSGAAVGPIRLDGESLAFHAVNGAGTAAFLATALEHDPGAADWALYYRPAGGGVARLIGAGDAEPGGGRTIAALHPPSRLDASGRILVPVQLSDGSTLLLGYDGAHLFRIAGSGDAAPGGGAFLEISTGSRFLGTRLPPFLTDEGTVLFGALTDALDNALFSALCVPGGGSMARVLGQGEATDTGRLRPFELQALDADDTGRIAFGSTYDDEVDFGAFLKTGAGITTLGRRFDLVDDLGFALRVDPQLALAGPGAAAWGYDFFDGGQAIVLGSGDPIEPSAAVVIAATGREAPDGGLYRFLHAGFRTTTRLASDGRGTIAFAAATDAGPEGIFAYGAPPDAPPVADAGADQTVECAGPVGTAVALDGTGSHDPDGAALRHVWSGPFGTVEGERPTVLLPLGTWTITLVVDDGALASDPDTVIVTVRDTLPPEISAQATPALLWPPDGRLVEVGVQLSVTDRCTPTPAVTLVAATSSEPGAGGQRGSQILGAGLGTDDRVVSLRAERAGDGPGRAYTLVYRAADGSGNAATASATVSVPHDHGVAPPRAGR